MLPSLHDDYLVAYEVNCEARQIKLLARHPAWKKLDSEPTIIFDGVEGYDFRDDAFGNIIFSLDAVSVERILAEFGAQIAESYRLAGAPGPWAADLASAAQVLGSKGVRGFILSSSMGPFRWVLAKDASTTGVGPT